MRPVHWLAGAALVLSCQATWAQDPARFYLGLAVGLSDIDESIVEPGSPFSGTGLVTPPDADVDGTDTGVKIFAGYRVHPNFAVELAHVDLGKLRYRDPDFFAVAVENGRVEVSGFNISAVGLRPVNPQLELFAKAGLFFWEAKARDVSQGIAFDYGKIDGTHLSLGFGGNYYFENRKNVGARIEWEHFELDKDKASLLSASVFVTF